MESLPLSVLDLSPITQGSDAGQSLRNSGELARHVERLGYNRFWMAEHHSMPGIASAATAVALAYIAAHDRAVSASAQAESCCPTTRRSSSRSNSARWNRCSLVGSTWVSVALRAPIRLRRMQCAAISYRTRTSSRTMSSNSMGYFRGESGRVRAIPGEGLDIPVWILGSSLFGAQLAAMLGLPYAFASHFAPQMMMQAISRLS